MITPARYLLADAAADLAAAGLLQGVLGGGAAGLAPTSMPPTGAAFEGAGLDARGLFGRRLFVALRGERADGRAFVPAFVHDGGWSLTRAWDGDGPDPLAGSAAPTGSGVLLSADPEAALRILAACHRKRLIDLRVVGITGTNGKTTTKDFVAAALAAAGTTTATAGNLNNRLGVPITLLGLGSVQRFAVIEMGASAVGDIERLAALARPHVGVITNASPAHLSEFGSLDAIVEGKGEMLDALPGDGTAILNADSPGYRRWCARARCRVVSFGRTSGDHRWSWRPGSEDEPATMCLDGANWPGPLPGEHNGANMAAAILAARAAGAADEAIRRGLEAFQGSPHRGVLLAIGGRKVLDDAYNANPESMVAAVRALGGLPGAGRKFAALGWMAELGDDSAALHLETGRRLAVGGLDVLVAVGEIARPLCEGFDAAGGESHYCATVEEAAALLVVMTAPGDRLLVKGSRSAGMERLLGLLEAACNQG